MASKLSRGKARVKKAAREIVRFIERETGLTGALVDFKKHPIFEFDGIRIQLSNSPSSQGLRRKVLADLKKKLRRRATGRVAA